jgi:hypothetical protein
MVSQPKLPERPTKQQPQPQPARNTIGASLFSFGNETPSAYETTIHGKPNADVAAEELRHYEAPYVDVVISYF